MIAVDPPHNEEQSLTLPTNVEATLPMKQQPQQLLQRNQRQTIIL